MTERRSRVRHPPKHTFVVRPEAVTAYGVPEYHTLRCSFRRTNESQSVFRVQRIAVCSGFIDFFPLSEKQAEFARTLADKLDGIKLEPPKKKALKAGNEADNGALQESPWI